MIHAKKTCSQFKKYQEAEKYYKAKKPGYKSLDRNHDGVPCQKLWKAELSAKKKQKAILKIYKYGSSAGYGQTFSSMSACEKERVKLIKSHKGTDYTYECESK